MTWVADRLSYEDRVARIDKSLQALPYAPVPPAWMPVWEEINAVTHATVREFNHAKSAEQFRVSAWPNRSILMEIVSLPAAHRIATLVLQVTDERTGDLGLTCPPEGEGIGRRGRFRMCDGKIAALKNFVGNPQPPTAPMTAADFVRFILEPLLFPKK